MTSLGGVTKTTILIMESHKMAIEFTVAAGSTVQLGQPVALNTDGTVRPWAAADGAVARIGYAYTSGYAGNLITVFCKGYSLQYAVSGGGAVTAGPATYTGYSTTALTVGGTSGYNMYANSTDVTLVNAFIITPAAGANQLIQVILF